MEGVLNHMDQCKKLKTLNIYMYNSNFHYMCMLFNLRNTKLDKRNFDIDTEAYNILHRVDSFCSSFAQKISIVFIALT